MSCPSTLVGIPMCGLVWHWLLISEWWSYSSLVSLYTTLGQQESQTWRAPATQHQSVSLFSEPDSAGQHVLNTSPLASTTQHAKGLYPKAKPHFFRPIFYLLCWHFQTPSFPFKPLRHQLPSALPEEVLEPASIFRLPCWLLHWVLWAGCPAGRTVSRSHGCFLRNQ